MILQHHDPGARSPRGCGRVPAGEPLVSVRGLDKAYDGVQALADVSLDIAAGEIHALCGENGAGKSTLIKVIAGAVRPDRGQVRVNGDSLSLGDVAASEAAGVAVIHQEVVVFPHLDARDNIFVGREPRRWAGLALDRRRMRRETQALMDRIQERFDVSRPVGELPLAQRQMVAIARALSRRCRLLIMDEPTAALSARETQVLLRIVRQLRSEGVAILYVSHRLEEICRLADRVTVLRDGRVVGTQPIRDVDQPALIRMMIGRELLAEAVPPSTPPVAAPRLLDVAGLSRRGEFDNVSLHVSAGEIVGLSGLVGSGRSEFAQTVFGIRRPDAGAVRVAGAPLPAGSVTHAVRRGLALVPEDRQKQGLLLPMSVGDNLTLTVLRRLCRCGFRSAVRERSLARRIAAQLGVRTAGLEAPARSLSGGNQQKIALGKWLAAEPRVLILDEPTRGVDVGAKGEIYRLLRDLARQGMATLLISSDMPELLLLSDRILVMCSGRLQGELRRGEVTQDRLLELALPAATDRTEVPFT